MWLYLVGMLSHHGSYMSNCAISFIEIEDCLYVSVQFDKQTYSYKAQTFQYSP